MKKRMILANILVLFVVILLVTYAIISEIKIPTVFDNIKSDKIWIFDLLFIILLIVIAIIILTLIYKQYKEDKEDEEEDL